MRSVARAAADSWCLALLACSPLDHFPAGVCGNGVLEAGEDCDGRAGPGGTCGPVEDGPRACRLLCEGGCPEGWACAPSGSCHHGTGAFVAAGVTERAADEWRIGDVDGDARPDLVTLDVGGANTPGEVRVAFGTGAAGFGDPTTQRLPAGSARSLDVARVDGLDERDDVVVAVPTGVVVLRGLESRRLVSSPAQSYLVRAAQDPRLLFARVRELAPAESVLVLRSTEGGVQASPGALSDTDAYQNFSASFLDGARALTALGDRVPVGDLQGDGDDEVVLAFAGEQKVMIASPRRHWFYDTVFFALESQVLVLPPDLRVGSSSGEDRARLLADIDGDGDLDLVLPAYSIRDPHGPCVVLVAVNDERGTLGTLEPDARFEDCPLAAGDLDGDGRADFVLRDGVRLASGDALVPPDPLADPGPRWREALIADLDGDGTGDVAAAVADEPGIDLLHGPTLLPGPPLTTEGAPSLLREGDVDGDGVTDLVFRERRPGDPGDEIAVFYGGDLRQAAAALGPLGDVVRLEVGLTRQGTALTAAESIVAMLGEQQATQSFVIVPGSFDRTLLAPYALFDDLVGNDRPAVAFAGRFDDLAGTDVLAIGGRTEALDVWLLSGQAEAWLGRASHLGELWARIWRRPPPAGSVAAWTACALWARGDADGDGLDELVAVSPSARCEDDRVPRATVVLNPVNLPGEPAVPVALPRLSAPAAAIRLQDLDRDGCDDFIAVGPEGVLVHWCGEAEDQMTTTGPPDATAVAALQADGDAALELAVLAAGGVWLVDVGAAGDPRALVVAAEPAIAGAGDRLEAADASGDGLSDLWVGGAGGVELRQAVSSLDGAPP